MDLRDVIGIAWKRKLTVIMVAVAAVAVAAAIAFTRTKEYQATATLAMTPNVQKGQGFVASDDLATLLSTYAAIVDSSTTRAAAAQRLGHPLHASVSASTTAGTGILKISATSTSPREAAAAATALSRAFESTIAGNKQLLVVQVVDAATVPRTPVAPRPPLIIAAGLALGLGLGVALVIVLERWFDRIETVEDVTEAVSLPTLGYLARDRTLQRGGRSSLIWDNPELFRLQEGVRALRTNLQFSIASNHDLVQITSPSAADGKSTVAANLAVAIAGVGVPTLLVDADFRAPRQHIIFDLPNEEGLSTAMATIGDETPLAIQPSEFKNLSLITSGPLPPSPTEMLAARIEHTIGRLRQLGWMVVIDTPPVLPVSDARLVAPKVDAVLLIATAGRTKSGILRSALEQLALAQSNVVGVVLNQVPDSATQYARYGGYYNRAPEPAEPVGRD